MSIRSFLAQFVPSLKEEAPGLGMASDEELYGDENPDLIAQNEGLEQYWKMSKEPIIKAGLQHRNVSYLFQTASGFEETEDYAAHEPQLLPASDESLDQEIWEVCADMLDYKIERGFADVLDQMQKSAEIFGYSVGEIMWQEINGKILAVDIKDRDPSMFQFQYEQNQEGRYFWRIYKKESPYSDELIALSPRKFIVHVPQYLLENPYGESELRPLVNVWYGKKNVKLFFERHLERFGSGIMIYYYPEHSQYAGDATKRGELLTHLKNLRNQGILVVPKNKDIDQPLTIVEAQGAQDAFINYLNYADDMIAIALVGNNLALKASSRGSYALARSTSEIAKSEYEYWCASKLCNTVNEQLIRWMVDFNWMGVGYYPRLQLINPRLVKPTIPEAKEDEQEEDQKSVEIQGGKQTENQVKQQEFTEKKRRNQTTLPKIYGNSATFRDSRTKRNHRKFSRTKKLSLVH